MNANEKTSFIIKIEGAHESYIGGAVKKITGYIAGKDIVSVIDNLDLEANPRASRSSSVTDAIQESLNLTPQLFAFKTKGILFAFSQCEPLERSRFRFTIDNSSLEGILDGGHNTLAIGLYILKKAYGYCDETFPKGIKIWIDFKELWNQSKDILEKYLEYNKSNPDVSDLKFDIPVEIIVPRDTNDEACIMSFVNSLFEICDARNNNAQLNDSDKANHKGFYDDIKEYMEKKNPELAGRIAWKSNEGGEIKAQNLVALSLIPLNLIEPVKDEMGKEIEPIAPPKIYSAKGSALQHFERIMGSKDVTCVNDIDSKNKLINEEVASALKITADIPELYDYIFENFPVLYNKAGGSYGRISAVKSMNPEPKNKNKPPKKYTPFTKKEISTLSPEGFIMPVVYGLQTLMKKEEINGKTIITWSQPPMPFLVMNLGKIIEQYTLVINMCDFDPQKVGKAAQAYQMVLAAYKNVLNGSI